MPSSSARMDVLLGLTSSPPLAYSDSNDPNEFNEADVWGDDLDLMKCDSFVPPMKDKAKTEPSDTIRAFGSHRRVLGLDRDSNLSLTLGEAGGIREFPTLSGPVSSRGGTTIRLSTACMIPHILATDYRRPKIPQSAPVKVPDWSRMISLDQQMGERDILQEDMTERLPPHELLARENARNRLITFSVCEGVGRTLKGRDLSRVRNAVWRQTGFIE
eukprot:c29269_g1_i1 orf=585-1232(+)